MARRKNKNKTKEAPYLSETAMTKMAEGLVELVMGMISGKELTTDNKEKTNEQNQDNCPRCDEEHQTGI